MGHHVFLRTAGLAMAGVLLCAGLFSCGRAGQPAAAAGGEAATRSEQTTTSSMPDRLRVTDAGDADMGQAAEDVNSFSLDLFRGLRPKAKNLVCSPYSASMALTMTIAGARGQTQAEIKKALRLSLPFDRLHAASNALDQNLAIYNQFTCANSIWGQAGRRFDPAFLDTVAQYYGAPLQTIDLDGHYPAACDTINSWVADKTKGLITDLMSPDDAPPKPRLMMLVNAVHFKADWASWFAPARTQKQPFHLLDGKRSVEALMMEQTHDFRYVDSDSLEAIELPYAGERSAMLLLMPAAGHFDDFAQALDAEQLKAIIGGMKAGMVNLTMPRFKIDSEPKVGLALRGLGMSLAFGNGADFSGISGAPGDFWITAVNQKAVIEVDEYGTEAAAVTGVTWAGATTTTTALPPAEITLDHPFIYMIRDIQTGAILFIGQVTDPS